MSGSLSPRKLRAVIREALREPAPTRVPKGRRPEIVLTVDRSGAEQPPPGTVTAGEEGRLLLYVGRWSGTPHQGSPVVDQLRQADVVEIVCTTRVGAEFTSRQLRHMWRLADFEDAGLLSEPFGVMGSLETAWGHGVEGGADG